MDGDDTTVPVVEDRRAFLTEREREIVAGVDASDSQQSQTISRLNNRIDELAKDITLLTNHLPETAEEISEVVDTQASASTSSEVLTGGNPQNFVEVYDNPREVCFAPVHWNCTNVYSDHIDTKKLKDLRYIISWFTESKHPHPNSVFCIQREEHSRYWYSAVDFIAAIKNGVSDLHSANIFGYLPNHGGPDAFYFYIRFNRDGEILHFQISFATAGILIHDEKRHRLRENTPFSCDRAYLFDLEKDVYNPLIRDIEVHTSRSKGRNTMYVIDNPFTDQCDERIVSDFPSLTEPNHLVAYTERHIDTGMCDIDKVTITEPTVEWLPHIYDRKHMKIDIQPALSD